VRAQRVAEPDLKVDRVDRHARAERVPAQLAREVEDRRESEGRHHII
jgi:hypothetical protein